MGEFIYAPLLTNDSKPISELRDSKEGGKRDQKYTAN